MSHITTRLLGVLLTFIWGATFVLIKVGENGFSPVNLAVLRFVVAAAVFLPLFLFGLIPYRAIRRRDLPAFAGLLLTLLCGQFLLNFVLQSIPASVGSIVVQIAPAFTLLLSVLFRAERFRWCLLTGMIVALAGTTVVIMDAHGGIDAPARVLPFVLALLVPLAIALYNFLGKPLAEEYGPVNLAGQLVVACGVILSATIPFRVSIFREMASADPTAWGAVLGLALPATVLSYILWSVLLKRMARSQVASLMYIVPLFSVGLSVGLLDETVGVLFLLGTLLVLAGLLLVERSSARSG